MARGDRPGEGVADGAGGVVSSWRDVVCALPDGGSVVSGIEAAGCFDPEASNSAELVKQSAVRRVYRVAGPDCSYFVKHHMQRGIGSRLRNRVFGNPARSEYRVSRYAQSHGVPAVDVVACADRCDDWNPHVAMSVSVGLVGVVSLSEKYDALVAGGAERETFLSLLDSVARVVAVAHDNAFLHPDSHPGNILVREEEGGGFACFYADLYGVRCRRIVNDRDASRNLAGLGQWFLHRASRADRYRFLKTYATARGQWSSRRSLRTFARLVDGMSRKHACAQWRKRDRRIGGNNAYFARTAIGDASMAVVTLRDRGRAAHIGARFASQPEGGWLQRIADESSVADRSTDGGRIETETVFPNGWLTATWWRVAGSQAWRRYRTACLAMNHDIPSVVGLAHVSRRAGSSCTQESWVVQRAPAGVPLLRMLKETGGKVRSIVLEHAGRLVADTALRGLGLRGVCAARMEVVSLRGVPVVYWAGVEGAVTSGRKHHHVVMWMLAQLAASVSRVGHVSRSDRARALRACCLRLGWVRHGEDWRAVWRELSVTG